MCRTKQVLGGLTQRTFPAVVVHAKAATGVTLTTVLPRARQPGSRPRRRPGGEASGARLMISLPTFSFPVFSLSSFPFSSHSGLFPLRPQIGEADRFFLGVVLKNGTNHAVPPCAPGGGAPPPGGCLAGKTTRRVVAGEASFNDLMLRGAAGSGYRWHLGLSTPGGAGPALITQPFSVTAGALEIAEGEVEFEGSYWVSNRGAGDYAIALLDDDAELIEIFAYHAFTVTATLTQYGSDVTHLLEGTKEVVAALDAERGVHAVFTDLVVTGAGSNMKLHFTYQDTQSGVALEDTTALFRAVPYALRVDERCHNGVAPNLTVQVSLPAVPAAHAHGFSIPVLNRVRLPAGAVRPAAARVRRSGPRRARANRRVRLPARVLLLLREPVRWPAAAQRRGRRARPANHGHADGHLPAAPDARRARGRVRRPPRSLRRSPAIR